MSDATIATNQEQEEVIETCLWNTEIDPLDTEFSQQELSRSLLHLPDKAVGLDRIHNRMMKNLDNRESLLEILNRMFRQ